MFPLPIFYILNLIFGLGSTQTLRYAANPVVPLDHVILLNCLCFLSSKSSDVYSAETIHSTHGVTRADCCSEVGCNSHQVHTETVPPHPFYRSTTTLHWKQPIAKSAPYISIIAISSVVSVAWVHKHEHKCSYLLEIECQPLDHAYINTWSMY